MIWRIWILIIDHRVVKNYLRVVVYKHVVGHSEQPSLHTRARGYHNLQRIYCIAVLWIRNDLFRIRIQLRIFGVLDPYPTLL